MARLAGFSFVLFFFLSSIAPRVDAAEGTTKVIWHGHAAFEVVTPKGQVIFIDPWLKNPANPAAKNGQDALAPIAKADYILITHGHFDHVGDSIELAKKTKARLVTNFELGAVLGGLGYPKDQMGFDSLMNMGGEIALAGGEVTVAMTPALHSSGVTKPGANGAPDEVLYGGSAAGFVLKIQGGPTIYDTGDTAFFSDMKLIGEQYAPDLALINIGGHFGMEPAQAAKAAESVRAKLIVPHHFGTFPVLTQNADSFRKALTPALQKRLRVLEPGQTLEFKGRNPA